STQSTAVAYQLGVSRCYSSVLIFFFFQAEDGIRDKLVTGVQTCALPIWGWLRRRPWPRRAPRKRGPTSPFCARTPLTASRADSRSEERRVGKECRYRRASYN